MEKFNEIDSILVKWVEIAKSGRRDLAPDGAPARPRRGARLSM